jgi:hypothetical protein
LDISESRHLILNVLHFSCVVVHVGKRFGGVRGGGDDLLGRCGGGRGCGW